jgi:hypothetical protein
MTGRYETTITRLQRGFGDKRGIEHVAQGFMTKAVVARLINDLGQVGLW